MGIKTEEDIDKIAFHKNGKTIVILDKNYNIQNLDYKGEKMSASTNDQSLFTCQENFFTTVFDYCVPYQQLNSVEVQIDNNFKNSITYNFNPQNPNELAISYGNTVTFYKRDPSSDNKNEAKERIAEGLVMRRLRQIRQQNNENVSVKYAGYLK